MQAVFASDQTYYTDNDGSVYSTKLPYSVWERYLNHFSHLMVIGRKGGDRSSSGKNVRLVKSSGGNVDFQLFRSVASVRRMVTDRWTLEKQICSVVASSQIVLARLPSIHGEIAIKAAKKHGKKLIVEMVGCPFDSYWNYGSLLGKLVAVNTYLNTRRLVLESGYVIYVTEKFLQRRYPTKGLAIGVSDVELSNGNDNPLLLRVEKIRTSGRRLGIMTALTTKAKGIEVALMSVKDLVKSMPDVQLEVVGPGDPERWIQFCVANGIRDNVIFRGVIKSGPEVFAWLDSIDMYIQPSFQEGLPRALVEAMSRACPCLGSTAGGIPELLSNDCLHKPGDHTKLAELVFEGITSEEKQISRSKANYVRSLDFRKSVLDAKRDGFIRVAIGSF